MTGNAPRPKYHEWSLKRLIGRLNELESALAQERNAVERERTVRNQIARLNALRLQLVELEIQRARYLLECPESVLRQLMATEGALTAALARLNGQTVIPPARGAGIETLEQEMALIRAVIEA